MSDIEELGNLDASAMHARRLNAKEVITQNMVNISYPNRRWNSQVVWKRSWNPKVHSNARLTCEE